MKRKKKKEHEDAENEYYEKLSDEELNNILENDNVF